MCPELLDAPGFCAAHAKKLRQADDQRRGSSASRGYGGQWRKRRAAWLAAHPLCEDPFGAHGGRPVPATDVDHMIPKRFGGADDESNYQSLCHECHSRKTRTEMNQSSELFRMSA